MYTVKHYQFDKTVFRLLIRVDKLLNCTLSVLTIGFFERTKYVSKLFFGFKNNYRLNFRLFFFYRIFRSIISNFLTAFL